MKILSKFLAFSFFLLSTFYLLSSAAPVYAASQTTPTPMMQHPTPNTNSDVPNNPHFSTQSTVIEIMSAITCQLSGIDPINPKQSCLGVDQKTGKIGFLQNTNITAKGGGGAIGLMGNMISMLYTPPLHTSDYFQNLAQNFGITKKAYAQTTGTGFDGLKPLLGLWTAFRNIAYLVFVIVFIVIGLAIMLRVKIDPRTVMTIQNQIPKIIIGILLVTFSYAIAGFLIDMMYVSIHLTGNIIASSDSKNPNNFGIVQNVSTASNPFRAIGAVEGQNTFFALNNLAWKPAEATSKPIAELFDNEPGRIIMGIVGSLIGSKVREVSSTTGKAVVGGLKGITSIAGIALAPFTGGASLGASVGINSALSVVGNFFGSLGGTSAPSSNLATKSLNVNPNAIADSVGSVVGFIAGRALSKQIISSVLSIIIFLIILTALLFALFRLWFNLLSAYIHILLDVVFAPFWIIGGIVPGSPISFSGWLRDIVANLAAFPVTIAMFLLGKVFVDAFTCDLEGVAAAAQTCKDALTHNFVPPLIGNRLEPETLGALIGLGIILITPNILNIIKTALKVPKVDTGLGKAIGVGISTPLNIIKGAIGIKQSAEEIVFKKLDAEGQVVYGKRELGGAIFGKFR